MIDDLLAATAKIHGLTLVTRNVADVARTGIFDHRSVRVGIARLMLPLATSQSRRLHTHSNHLSADPMRLRIVSDLHHEFGFPWRWPADRDRYDLIVAAGDIAGSCPEAIKSLEIRAGAVRAGQPRALPPCPAGQYRRRPRGRGRNAGLFPFPRYRYHRRRAFHRRLLLDGLCALRLDKALDDHRRSEPQRPPPRPLPRGEDPATSPASCPGTRAANISPTSSSCAARSPKPMAGQTVVVTHHLPSGRSVAPRFAASVLNPAFASDLDHLIEEHEPALWIHGHTHENCPTAGSARPASCAIHAATATRTRRSILA